jgi:uncharacterized protein (TIGR02271 family)
MKRKIWFQALPMAFVGLAAALSSGCQSKSKPVAYSTSPVYYSGGSQTGSRYTSGSEQSSQGAQASTANETVIPLSEESIKVGTRETDAGSVRIRKVVKTETVSQPVQVRHETVVVDRLPADASAQSNQQAQQGASAGTPFQENEIVIQLKKEEPVVETQIVPKGKVVAQKRSNTEQQNIQRQVRREDVEVIKEGNTENVTVSDNLRNTSKAEATGAGPSGTAQTQGSASSQTISDFNQFASATDKSTLAGSSVKLSDAKVQKVSGDHLLAIGTDPNSQVWVHTSQPISGIKEGDTVRIQGKVQPTAQAATSLGEEATQLLQGQPVFIEGKTVEKAGQ